MPASEPDAQTLCGTIAVSAGTQGRSEPSGMRVDVTTEGMIAGTSDDPVNAIARPGAVTAARESQVARDIEWPS